MSDFMEFKELFSHDENIVIKQDVDEKNLDEKKDFDKKDLDEKKELDEKKSSIDDFLMLE